MNGVKSIKGIQIVGFLLITILIAIFYYQSLSHQPRSDQWSYLVDTFENHSVWDTFKNSYSYNRTRIMAPGDTGLFRPLLFMVLSLEKGLFGNHFWAIQLVGIFLHLIVILLFFALLNMIREFSGIKKDQAKDREFNILGILFISFYALNFSFTEIIIWSHLHAYIIFHIFVLTSLLLILKYFYNKNWPSIIKWSALFSIWILSLLATFTYELGQIFSFLVGLTFFWSHRKDNLRKGLSLLVLFCAIPLLYQAINFYDLKVHEGFFQEDVSPLMILKRTFSLKTVEHTLRFLSYVIVHPFFPSMAMIRYSSRVVIGELRGEELDLVAIPSLLAFLAWALILFFGIREIKRKKFVHMNLFLVFLVMVYLGYLSLIVLGRMNMRPLHGIITTSTYYVYFPLGYLIIITMILLAYAINGKMFSRPILTRSLKQIILICLPIIIISSLIQIWSINSMFSRNDGYMRNFVNSVQSFIDRNKRVKLAFDLEHSDGLPSAFGIPFTTVLFRNYEDNFNPDYVGIYSGGNFDFIRAGEYRSKFKLPSQEQIAPILVKIGDPYNIYFFRGRYVAVQRSDGPYIPKRPNYSYLISMPSIEEVLKEIPIQMTKRQVDLRQELKSINGNSGKTNN